jgi:hypothetical protein
MPYWAASRKTRPEVAARSGLAQRPEALGAGFRAGAREGP